MNRVLVYFLGILTGVILTIAVALIINNSSSGSGITMFNERGEMMESTQYTVMQTLDSNHGLALGGSLFAIRPVLLIGNKDAHFYDGLVVKAGFGTRFYQVGTYRYKAQDNMWKTLPAIALLPEQ